MTRFDGLSMEEAQKAYRAAIFAAHPDRGGDEEEAKRINAEFDSYMAHIVNGAFAEAGDRTRDESAQVFADILAKVARMPCRAEIIGFWIYCFDAYAVREELKTIGFWFSVKHKAWIYSGRRKIPIRSHMTTAQVRNRWGSTPIEHVEEERKEIAS